MTDTEKKNERVREIPIDLESAGFEGKQVVIGVVKFGEWNKFKKVFMKPLMDAIQSMVRNVQEKVEDEGESETLEEFSKAESMFEQVLPLLDDLVAATDEQLPKLIKMCVVRGELPDSFDDLDAFDVVQMREAVDDLNDIERLLDTEKKSLVRSLGSLVNSMITLNKT